MAYSDTWLLVAAGVLTLILLMVLWWFIRRRHQNLRHLLKRHAWRQARDVVIPDGMDGHVHIDYVLLTRRGLVILETKELSGAVFGAEKMDEWVMLDRSRRYGFRNPLAELDDRVAALKSFVEGIRVEAYVLITGPVEFPKGRPVRTLRIDDLTDRLEPVSGEVPDGWRGLWNKIAGRAEG
ncbi:hypothetical protein J2T60_000732 [Natronospira proteinivora]|uniref:NERD domain-containing protein n=1 Tax=Natronospira proteinivora TaxID=1807133 RepID=A0ABT1G640_9GAMM|nr:nuclease-related domain-containing protein [Natronospira proteinivora]MCP1726767.1 hypothetical protein [Natronospira proteinivora]